MVFEFKNGNLRFFADTWDIYKIGKDTLNVTEEKAITIAMDTVPKDYSYQVTYWNGTISNITGLNVANNTVRTELQISRSREPLTLYPYWIVHLYFDQVYPTNFYGWTAYIWADTGEAFKVEPKLFMGDLTSQKTQTPSQTSNSNTSPTQPSQPSATQPMPPPQAQDSPHLQPQTTATPAPASIEQNPTSSTILYTAATTIAITITITATAAVLKKKSRQQLFCPFFAITIFPLFGA